MIRGFIWLTAAVLFVSGCKDEHCDPQLHPYNQFEAVEKGRPLSVTCLGFGSRGIPGQHENYRHVINFRLPDGVFLGVYFHNSNEAPVSIDIQSCAADDFHSCGAEVHDYGGSGGEARALCGSSSESLVNAAVSGTLTLTKLVVGEDGYLDEAHGEVVVTLEDCELPYADSDGTLTLRGRF